MRLRALEETSNRHPFQPLYAIPEIPSPAPQPGFCAPAQDKANHEATALARANQRMQWLRGERCKGQVKTRRLRRRQRQERVEQGKLNSRIESLDCREFFKMRHLILLLSQHPIWHPLDGSLGAPIVARILHTVAKVLSFGVACLYQHHTQHNVLHKLLCTTPHSARSICQLGGVFQWCTGGGTA